MQACIVHILALHSSLEISEIVKDDWLGHNFIPFVTHSKSAC
jgi:hypothetical protein